MKKTKFNPNDCVSCEFWISHKFFTKITRACEKLDIEVEEEGQREWGQALYILTGTYKQLERFHRGDGRKPGEMDEYYQLVAKGE